MSSIWRCMAEVAIDGLKRRTFGPRSGFAGFAARAGRARQANSTASHLPDIGSHRFFGQGGGEPVAVVFHVKGPGKVGGVGSDQYDLATGSKKGGRRKLL